MSKANTTKQISEGRGSQINIRFDDKEYAKLNKKYKAYVAKTDDRPINSITEFARCLLLK